MNNLRWGNQPHRYEMFGRTGGTWRLLTGIGLAAVTLTSCASKTAALHPAPYFSPSVSREASNAVDAGDRNFEIAGLRQAVMSRPADLGARLKLAQAYATRGFSDVALEHYRLAAERFPDSAPAAIALARALRKAELKEQALSGLKAFIQAKPQKYAEPYEWLGILNDDLQNWKAAQAAYETALLYAPSNAELHNNLGYALLMQDLNASAIAEFRKALSLKHDLSIARNNLGIAYASTPKEAILHWQAISGPAAAHNNMAALFIERGDYAQARQELESALGYDQQNPQAIYNLALVAERDGQPAVLPPAKASGKQQSNGFAWLRPGRRPAKAAESRSAAAGEVAQAARRPVDSSGAPDGK